MKNIVILISWRGSNLNAIMEAGLPAKIAAVVSNNPAAPGLKIGEKRGIPTEVVNSKQYPGREEFSDALENAISKFQPDLLVLAGFMRVLSDSFVNRYQGRMLNIHPSLLPAFAGKDPHKRALDAGVKISGCTVHFVTPAVDAGPIIIQAAVPVHSSDTQDTLAARILEQEHRVYPQAIRWFVEGKLTMEGNQAKLIGLKDVHRVLLSPGESD